MATKIEWATETWNPVTGCTKVSEGCKNCYAERMANRLQGQFGYPADDPFRVTLHEDKLDKLKGWEKPRRIFVCSMGDLFHAEVPFDFQRQVFDRMWNFPQHTYLLLTKRPNQMKDFFQKIGIRTQCTAETELPFIWLGVTAENQATADERIPVLLDIPAAVRFVSCEPLLERVDVSEYLDPCYNAFSGDYGVEERDDRPILDWVIVGGETGPGARYMDPDWARAIHGACHSAGTSFFFKKMSNNEKTPLDLMIREFPDA